MSEQIAVRLPDDLAESLEELVERGSFASKAEAVRSAVERLVDAERRRRVGDLIANGYIAHPQAADDDLGALSAATVRRTAHALDVEDAGDGEW